MERSVKIEFLLHDLQAVISVPQVLLFYLAVPTVLLFSHG